MHLRIVRSLESFQKPYERQSVRFASKLVAVWHIFCNEILYLVMYIFYKINKSEIYLTSFKSLQSRYWKVRFQFSVTQFQDYLFVLLQKIAPQVRYNATAIDLYIMHSTLPPIPNNARNQQQFRNSAAILSSPLIIPVQKKRQNNRKVSPASIFHPTDKGSRTFFNYQRILSRKITRRAEKKKKKKKSGGCY